MPFTLRTSKCYNLPALEPFFNIMGKCGRGTICAILQNTRQTGRQCLVAHMCCRSGDRVLVTSRSMAGVQKVATDMKDEVLPSFIQVQQGWSTVDHRCNNCNTYMHDPEAAMQQSRESSTVKTVTACCVNCICWVTTVSCCCVSSC